MRTFMLGFGPVGLADRLNEARERMALALAALPVEDQEALVDALEEESQSSAPSG